MKIYFDHEKLEVYQEALAFCGWAGDLIGEINGKAAAKDQLEVLARNELGEDIVATPAIVRNAIYIRTSANLYAFEGK